MVVLLCLRENCARGTSGHDISIDVFHIIKLISIQDMVCTYSLLQSQWSILNDGCDIITKNYM